MSVPVRPERYVMATFSGGPLHGRAWMMPVDQLGFWFNLRVTDWRLPGVGLRYAADGYYARESRDSTRFVLSDPNTVHLRFVDYAL